MTNSILHPTSWLYALALLLLACQSITIASAASVTAGSGSGNLRGVQVEKESANSGNEGPSDEEDSRRRQLYGRQYSQGFESLTQSYSSVPLEHQGQTETANVTSLHSLQGQPVYFEKQSDEPFNPYLRVVGGGPSAEQRNFCMHLNWDVYSNQYVFAGCGGTLIGNCHVLTAAHCSAASRAGMPDGVFCNAYNPFQGNYGRPYHFSTVTNIIMHPAHSMVTNQNDISILQLDTCVPSLAQFPVMQVATPTFLARLPASQSLIVSGYGRTSQHDPTQVSSLQSVALPYIPTATCNNYYPGYVMADMICAGQASGGLDACQGDSGGPLFYQGLGGDTNQTVVGIVSWGGGCAQPNQPGVYTNVAYFYDWIKNIVCNDARTDQSIALCRPAVTYSLTSASASISFNTCATLHQACNARSCCSGYVCTAGASGYAPTCTVPASSRSSGSGALGRATGWND